MASPFSRSRNFVSKSVAYRIRFFHTYSKHKTLIPAPVRKLKFLAQPRTCIWLSENPRVVLDASSSKGLLHKVQALLPAALRVTPHSKKEDVTDKECDFRACTSRQLLINSSAEVRMFSFLRRNYAVYGVSKRGLTGNKSKHQLPPFIILKDCSSSHSNGLTGLPI